MEIEKIIYKAKDGRTFFDPIECEEYEKKLGILPGSVGELVNMLEKHTKRDNYIFAIVKVQDGENSTFYTRATLCVDDKLEDFVNVDNLTEEQRYITATAGELIDTMKELDQDLPCQYFVIYFKDVLYNNADAFANHNREAWSKDPSDKH